MRAVRLLLFLAFLSSSAVFSQAEDEHWNPEFFQIEKSIRSLLEKMPEERAGGGARFIMRSDGSVWLVSIGRAAMKSDSTAAFLLGVKEARARARIDAVKLAHGTEASIARSYEIEETKSVNGKAVLDEKLDSEIISKAKGILDALPDVAIWKDREESVCFVAIGKQVR